MAIRKWNNVDGPVRTYVRTYKRDRHVMAIDRLWTILNVIVSGKTFLFFLTLEKKGRLLA